MVRVAPSDSDDLTRSRWHWQCLARSQGIDRDLRHCHHRTGGIGPGSGPGRPGSGPGRESAPVHRDSQCWRLSDRDRRDCRSWWLRPALLLRDHTKGGTEDSEAPSIRDHVTRAAAPGPAAPGAVPVVRGRRVLAPLRPPRTCRLGGVVLGFEIVPFLRF